jgi:hypothetical protein
MEASSQERNKTALSKLDEWQYLFSPSEVPMRVHENFESVYVSQRWAVY